MATQKTAAEDEAMDRIARQVADLVGNLIEAKWQKFPSRLIEVAERMEQVGSGAADSRELFARYKLLFTSEFPDLMAWEFALAISTRGQVETDKVLNQAIHEAAVVFTMVIIKRLGDEELEGSGNLEHDVSHVFSQVTVDELIAALDRLEPAGTGTIH
jgi:hypothetical protein